MLQTTPRVLILCCMFILSLGTTINQLTLGVQNPTIFSTPCSSYSYFKVQVTNPCQNLVVSLLTYAGQADIYVAATSKVPVYPTADQLTWASFTKVNTTLTVSYWEPLFSPGTYYIGVFGDCYSKNVTSRYKITAYQQADSSGDLLVNPALGLNQRAFANGYTYYKFCVPYDCASVSISATYQWNATIAPTTYVNMDVLMSRTNRNPNVMGNVVHGWVETITTDVNDPSARDNNGFLSGTYYVAVFGWCTWDPYCLRNSTCGPCRNYGKNGAPFNLSVSVNNRKQRYTFTKLLIYSVSS